MCLAIPGKITNIKCDNSSSPVAKVNFGGIQKDVSLAFVPDAKIGEYVIVHVGFALNKVDEKEAVRIFEYYEEMDELTKEERQR